MDERLKLARALMGIKDAPMTVAPLFSGSYPQMPPVFSPTGELAAGQTEMGNVNLMDRPNVPNPAGGWSSVRSMNANIGGEEVLMPTVSPGGLMTPDAAIDQYQDTGAHLGKFLSPEAAEMYAKALHDQQAAAGVARPPSPYTFPSLFSGWDKR
jgi:hypothetical protein